MDNSFWAKKQRGSEFERWPKNSAGEPEEPKWLCNLRNTDLCDELLVNMLEAYGIPCLRLYPGDGEFGKVVLGMSGNGSDIYVPASMFEDAVAICTASPEEPDYDMGMEE